MPVLNQPCIICCRPTSMWCSRCQSAWYCCPEHLNSDWARHRLECVPVSAVPSVGYNNLTATPSPVEDQFVDVSAIMFAPEEEKPRIIQVTCRPTTKYSQSMCPLPMVEPYFPDGQMEGIVLTQGLNGENLRFPLHLFYSPTAFCLNAPVNRAVGHITSSAAPKPWCGPVVVLKYNGSRRQGYTHAGTNDLPALSAYFLNYK